MMTFRMANQSTPKQTWDTTTSQEFLDYYERVSKSPVAVARFRGHRDQILGLAEQLGLSGPLNVADIGGGAGTAALLWAELGHKVFCLDINLPLIRIADRRSRDAGYDTEFFVASATDIPLQAGSMDVCLVPELLEHVVDWERCLDEFSRILKPGGILFLTTSNFLCPIQKEFNLPLYSWYPAPLKRHFERVARTSKPAIANHAKYPAVNWFSFYSLRRALFRRGFARCFDRFDFLKLKKNLGARKFVLDIVNTVPGLKLVGYMASGSSLIVAIKSGDR